ncbi:MAG TPA: PDZ domain-containing protein [Planctomycetota bacterium]|nr:PDZ domain-containing protein [Planctomycetota bacterium]
MQKTVIGILFILVLILAATNVRLADRQRFLEDRLATAERKRPAPAATIPETPLPAPAATPVSAVAMKQPEAPTVPVMAAPEPTTNTYVLSLGTTAPKIEAEMTRLLQANTKALEAQLLTDGTLQLSFQNDTGLLPSGQRPGFLGISGNDAKGGGVEISAIMANGIAGAAGLQPGDVILAFNGEAVAGLADFTRRIRESGEGAPVSLRIRRNGVEFVQGVQLLARPW